MMMMMMKPAESDLKKRTCLVPHEIHLSWHVRFGVFVADAVARQHFCMR